MLATGATVDRYEVVSMLGSGGMADVYAVRHTALGTMRALKVLRHGNPQLTERLLREGRAQATLDHPNVVRVLDVVQAEGAPGLILELVDGPTLDQVVRDGPLPVEQVVDLLRQVVMGLHAAHRAGIVHRDLKPSNVVVDRVTSVARITDFGLAAVLDEPDRNEARLTRPGATLGTPAYMAPEQYQATNPIDERADVWALGVLAYEMCTGVTPVEGLPVVAGWHRMTSGQWQRLEQARPDLPPRMGKAIEWALRPERAERCPSVIAFWRAFSEEGSPVPEARPTLPPRSDRSTTSPDTWVNSEPPSVVRDLVGREAELASVWERLASRGGMVTLVGTGGVGKTRLAAEIHARWDTERRAVWVDLEPARTEDDVVHRVGFVLGDAGDGSAREVGVALARGALLLVLDNLEQLPQRPLQRLLQDWLTAAPSLRILATSRQAVGLGLEQVVELSPLPVVTEGDPRELAAWMVLLRAAPPGTLDGVDPALAGRLLASLDGLPLALELAAARLEVLEADELARRLEHRLDVLADPDATASRHGGLRSAIRWSWSLLPASEQEALAALSAFRGSFTLSAAESVVGPRTLDALHGLVRRHLVTRSKGRFSLLGSIREFAQEQLTVEARDTAWRRHATWIGAEVRPTPGRGGDAEHLERLEASSAEVWAVIQRAAELPELGATAWTVAQGMMELYRVRGPVQLLEALARRVLALPPGPDLQDRERLEQGLRTMLALALRHTSRLAEARAELHAALRLLGDQPSDVRAVVSAHLADLDLEEGKGDPEAYERVIAMAQVHGPRHLVRTCAASLATLVTKDQERAERALALSATATDHRDPMAELTATKSHAWVLLAWDRLEEARGVYLRASDLAATLHDGRSTAYIDGQLGLIAETLGRLDEALERMTNVVDYMHAHGDRLYECWYRMMRARVALRTGRWDQALQDARTAHSLAPESSPGRTAEDLAAALLLRSGQPVPKPTRRSELYRELYRARGSTDRAALTTAVAAVRAALDPDIPTRLAFEHLLREAAPDGWRIAADGTWFEDAGGTRVDTSRHQANARILAHLAQQRITAPGAVSDAAALAAAGWPGERIVATAAGNRVRVALSALRAQGLEPLVQRHAGGWRLDPDQPVSSA